ncbi:MAG TPA: YbaN family protein [Thiobacillaceae bacterium]|nr:YbaN family protein [Thiobacillaceae bacterium]
MEQEAIGKSDTDGHRHAVPVRLLFAGLGTLFLALGAIGVFLPLLPTTPFLLLAAACFARASRRISRLLLAHPHFGPLIHEWGEHRSIPYRAKRRALALIALSFAVSIVFFVPGWPAKVIMGMGGLILMAWIAHIPSRDAPPRVPRNRTP